MTAQEIKRQPCMIYSRCCGWYSAKHQGNPGKQAEIGDRKTYDVNSSLSRFSS